MATKLLGVNQLQMYERMIKDEFKPIIDVLEARGNNVRGEVVQQVKAKFGLYELDIKIKAAEVQLTELKGERTNLTGNLSRYSAEADFTNDSIVGKEVTRTMDSLNQPLADAKNKRNAAIKELRLSGLPEQIQNVFIRLDDLVEKLEADIKKLPAITPRLIKGKK